MRLLRLDLYQETVCYKTPFSTKISETYPLPPYSTVIGMLHALLDAKEYIKMDVSIQGTYVDKFSDYATSMLYKDKGMKKVEFMPYHRHMLNSVNLVLHISASDDVLDALYDAVLTKGISFLGRSEDIVRVDDVSIVNAKTYTINEDIEDEDDLEDGEIEPYLMKNNVYVPSNYDVKIGGVYYRLAHHYTKERRNWTKVNSVYVEKCNILNEGVITLDEKGDMVFLTDAN